MKPECRNKKRILNILSSSEFRILYCAHTLRFLNNIKSPRITPRAFKQAIEKSLLAVILNEVKDLKSFC
jgi:hypothetical protein